MRSWDSPRFFLVSPNRPKPNNAVTSRKVAGFFSVSENGGFGWSTRSTFGGHPREKVSHAGEITMKRHWGTEELVEHWTLLPRETELLTNKTGATRLGFAVMLKFFRLEAYFPQQASAVPTVAVEFIAKQVKVAPEQFERYQWRGRTIEYHCEQIRKLHGFRETTVEDAQALSHWLCEQVLPRE